MNPSPSATAMKLKLDINNRDVSTGFNVNITHGGS